MKYICVDPVEYLYPDIFDYKSGATHMHILTARNSYACGQVLIYDAEGTLNIECEGWNPEIYEMVAIPVEKSIRVDEKKQIPHTPERMAPFFVYDCLKPYKKEINVKEGVIAIYFSMWISKDADVGTIKGSVKIGSISIPVEIEISVAVVPDETLTMLLNFSKDNITNYHNVVEGSTEFDEIETKYLSILRRMRQNAIFLPEPNSYPRIIKKGENQYEFDFTNMEAFIKKGIDMGYKKFYLRLGYRESWKNATILVNGLSSMSSEAYCFLAQYLPALVKFLDSHEWTDYFLLSICDEPNAHNALEYRAFCSLVRKFAPNIKLIDAISYGYVDGSVDICVPLSSEYQKHRKQYEMYRQWGDEIWYYDALSPRCDGYINRFMDYPLLSTRYHGWANYAYNLTGYLHWATNLFQPGQDPFRESCPIHRNTDDVNVLPPGDDHIMYPGDKEPWMSVRLENQRAGAEEYEMLCAIAFQDKRLADFICSSVFRSFNNVEYDPVKFCNTRKQLIRAMEQIC